MVCKGKRCPQRLASLDTGAARPKTCTSPICENAIYKGLSKSPNPLWGTPAPPWGQAPAAMSDATERLPPSSSGGRSRPGRSSWASTYSYLVRAMAPQCPEGVERKPDGRQCNCCSCKDSDWDEIGGEPMYMWWGYTPNPDGTARGDVCYYCVRVHVGRCKQKWAMHQLVAVLVKPGGELTKKLRGHRKMVVDFMVQRGARDLR